MSDTVRAAIELLDTQIAHLSGMVEQWKREPFWEIEFSAPGSYKAWALYSLKNSMNVRAILTRNDA